MSRAYLSILLVLLVISGGLIVHEWTSPAQEISPQIVTVSGLPGMAFSDSYLGLRPAWDLGPAEFVHPGLEPPDYTGFVYVH